MSNTLQIKVFGAQTSGLQLVVDQITKKLSEAELQFEISEVTDVGEFLKRGIESVPAIQYNEKPIVSLRENGDFMQSLRSTINDILDDNNYGTLSKVLVPVDFSKTSLNALLFAHRLATHVNAVTKVLHVYYPTSKDMAESALVDVDFASVRKSHLDALVDKINLEWGNELLKASFIGKEFKTGFPAENIIKSVDENNADLVVMGTTGDSSRIKKWFGSVSTKVGLESPVPTLLIPENAKYKDINNILYAYDRYEVDKICVKNLIPFAKMINAKIHFVHVNSPKDINPGFYLSEMLKDELETDKFVINQLETQEVPKAINDYALTHKIDMIVVGRQEKTFVQKLFDRSVTKNLAIHSSLPLLVIKSTD